MRYLHNKSAMLISNFQNKTDYGSSISDYSFTKLILILRQLQIFLYK